ncbi:MAG: OmpA family protein [Pseudomonadota bacterium]
MTKRGFLNSMTASAIVALATLAGPAPAFAQTVIGDEVVFDRAPTIEELRAIFGDGREDPAAAETAGPPTRGLSRSIVFHGESKPAPAAANGQSAARTERRARPPAPEPVLPALPREQLNIMIAFELNSAELHATQAKKLETLGQYLSENGEMKLLIAGHADATGSRAHNFTLSAERADSVRAYLVDSWGLAAGRFETAGYGETLLLKGIAANAPENRRVEFRLVRDAEEVPAETAQEAAASAPAAPAEDANAAAETPQAAPQPATEPATETSPATGG